MTLAEVIQIILGFLSLLATVAVSFFIFWLQKRHEKELRKEALRQSASVFRIDNHDEIDYLPLCVIAASVNKYAKHNRGIYTRFNKCSPELQQEILRQEGIPIGVAPNADWVSDFLDKLKKDTKKYKLGEHFLYDGGKYLHRAFEHYQSRTIKDLNQHIFDIPRLTKHHSVFSSVSQYIDRYLEYVLRDREDTANRPELLPQEPPWDLVIEMQDLRNCPEEKVCFWVMLLVKYSCIAFFRHSLIADGEAEWRHIAINSEIKTYEDLYYDTLLTLYTAYAEQPS